MPADMSHNSWVSRRQTARQLVCAPTERATAPMLAVRAYKSCCARCAGQLCALASLLPTHNLGCQLCRSLMLFAS